MTEQTILLTGGVGYIGLHTVLALQAAGFRPVVVDNLQRGRKQLLDAGVTFHQVDICDTQALTDVCRLEKPAAVIHLAARLSVEESTQIPLEYYDTNVVGTVSVCRAVRDAKVPHLVFSSTCCVYGNTDGTKPVDEATPLNACSPYGASKAMAEQVITDVGPISNFTSVTLRYFNVAGADAQLRAGPYTDKPILLIDRVCQAVCGDLSHLTVNGTDYATPDGTAIRDYVHVADIADAHVQAIRYLQAGGASATFNCGYGTGISVAQIIEAAKRISGVDFTVEYGPRRAGDIAAIAANTSAIRNIMGWTPRHDDLDTLITSAINWYKAQTGRR